MRTVAFYFIAVILFISCKKNAADAGITGNWQWTIQYANNPAYNSTPQSTGIQETLSFSSNGKYSVTQNGMITQAGNYKTTVSNTVAGKVSTVLYSNTRVRDSVAYYTFNNNGNNLVFSNDLSGTIGSGARYYNRMP